MYYLGYTHTDDDDDTDDDDTLIFYSIEIDEPQNIHNIIKNLFIYYSHSDPMGTDGQTNKWTNIYSLFRDKLSLPEGSSDITQKLGRARYISVHGINVSY
jgi:hypothetical protein